MASPILTATGLSKAYGTRVLLDGGEVAIGERERVGLVGDNGAGKSTLAKILAGIVQPDQGEVVTRRDARVAYLSQRPELAPGATAAEVVLSGMADWRTAVERHEAISEQLGAGTGNFDALLSQQAEAAAEVERLGGWERDHDVIRMLHHLGIEDSTAIVDRLSGGERRRVDLARLLVSAPDLAILDEPTNHLDVETIEWLERHFLSGFQGALLLVTHDRYVLERVAERTLELDRGALYAYQGGWSAYLAAKAERLAQLARTEANRQAFLRTELEWLRRSPSARRTKQKARVQRAESAIAARPDAARGVTKLSVETERLGNTIIDMRDLKVDVAGRRLVDGFTMHLTAGERIGIVGRSGCGKTSLLRVILGEDVPAEGSVQVGKNTRFAYFDQSRSDLDDDLSIQENVAGKATRIDFRGKTIDIRSYMARFLFDGAALRQKVGALSGGERARVALAILLLTPANVLIFDEPTNDLDVATLGALEEMLVEGDSTAIIVSHDRYFLDRVATSIVSFEGEGRVVRYVGDYQTFAGLRAQRRAEAKAQKPKAKKERVRRSPAFSSKEKRELEGMMDRIEEAEGEVARLDGLLAAPDLYSDRAEEVPALVEAQAKAQAAVDGLMARWEELEEKRAAAEG